MLKVKKNAAILTLTWWVPSKWVQLGGWHLLQLLCPSSSSPIIIVDYQLTPSQNAANSTMVFAIFATLHFQRHSFWLTEWLHQSDPASYSKWYTRRKLLTWAENQTVIPHLARVCCNIANDSDVTQLTRDEAWDPGACHIDKWLPKWHYRSGDVMGPVVAVPSFTCLCYKVIKCFIHGHIILSYLNADVDHPFICQ